MRLLSMVRGGGGTKALTRKEVDEAIVRLRNGDDVHVETDGQMQQIQRELGQLGVRSESTPTFVPQRPAVNKAGVKELICRDTFLSVDARSRLC
jgi:hypothetical protein